MALIHFGLYYGDAEATHNFIIFFFSHGLADWGAAAFLMMMGMSQVLSAKKIGKPDNWLLFKRALVRGTYIFGVGLLMLVLAWGPDKIWWWDILTLMGFATVVLFFCRFLPSWSLIGLIGAIMVLTPWFRSAFNVAVDWGFAENPVISQYVSGMYIEPVVALSPGDCQRSFSVRLFSCFPWIAFIIIGFVIGRRIVAQKMRRDLPILLLTGSVLSCLGIYSGLRRSYAASHLGVHCMDIPSMLLSGLL